MQNLILLALASFAPVQQTVPTAVNELQRLQAPSAQSAYAGVRTPIDAEHTPGDSDSVYRIRKPGSYFLTENLRGRDGAFGIEIAASDVTIDLMGFKMLGTAGSNDGISTYGSQSRIQVRNGSIVGFGYMGIDLVKASECHIERVTAAENGYVGIWAGHNSNLVECIARDNGDTGIRATTNSRVSGCIAAENVGGGIRVNTGGLVAHSLAFDNGLDGIDLISNGTVLSSTAKGNQFDGISIGPRSQALDCVANENLRFGIVGFYANTIERCEASSNGTAGIQVQNKSRVAGNVCEDNASPGDGAGILIKGWYNVVEDNLSVENDYAGYIVEGQKNLLRRNCAGNNTLNWAIFAGNHVRVLTATPSPGFLGDAGGLAPGPDDPNVNYTL